MLKESAGLGTSATRAGIIEKLIFRNMVVRKKKSLVPTLFGMEIVAALDGEDVLLPELTARWEEKLTKIEDGTLLPKQFLQEMIHYTTKTTNDLLQKNYQITSIAVKPNKKLKKR